MKRSTLLILMIGCLAVGQGARAQLQSITTYGSATGLGGTTTIQPMGNGYTYATIGGPSGGSWGGVIASPGTAVQAAIGPQGAVVPIVSTAPAPVVAPAPDPALVAAQIAAANAQELAADAQFLQSLPAIPSRAAPIRVARAIPVDHSKELNAEFSALFKKIGTKERSDQFWRDFRADFPGASSKSFPTQASIPYLKLWLRDHETEDDPGQNYVALHPVTQSTP